MPEGKGKMRRRKADKCLIFKVWDQINPYWHIFTTLFIVFVGVAWWVKDVNAIPDTVTAQGKRLAIVEEKVADIAVVKQRVDDIANFMGVPRRIK